MECIAHVNKPYQLVGGANVQGTGKKHGVISHNPHRSPEQSCQPCNNRPSLHGADLKKTVGIKNALNNPANRIRFSFVFRDNMEEIFFAAVCRIIGFMNRWRFENRIGHVGEETPDLFESLFF